MFRTLVTLGAAAALAAPAAALTVVDLDGRTNASWNGTNAVSLTLGQGRYQVRFVEGAFTSHNRWSGTATGCNSAGTSCTRGWENIAFFYLGANDFDRTNDLRVGEFAYFKTRPGAFANALSYLTEFVVPAGGATVSFYIPDTKVTDNVGGVSLGVSAIPEAKTWAMLIAGFGLVGLAMRRRRTEAAAHTA